MLPITNIAGETFLLNGIPQIDRGKKVNGEKTISFLVVPTEENKNVFDSVDVESRLIFDGEPYVIKKIQEKNSGQMSVKQVDAVHAFFDDMINSFQYNIHNGSQTFFDAMTRVFDPTPYDFMIQEAFAAETFENFGNDNCLALFQTLLNRFGSEFEVQGNIVFLKRKIGAKTGFQLRWRHNVKAIDKQLDTENLATYIKGYGKPKEETDVLTTTKIHHGNTVGVFLDGMHFNVPSTDAEGANFKFSFTGTGFNFYTGVHRLGGVWQFDIGGQKISVSTYKDVTYEEKTFEVVRGLDSKTYNVTATFIGKDSSNPNTKGLAKPFNVLLKGDIIGLYRKLVGDELYEVVDEYTSPNASKYPNPNSADGLRHSPPISDEKITSKTTMREKLIASLQDEPRLSITVDIAEIDGFIKNEGDFGYIIYEPMNVKMEARVVEINEGFRFINRKWTAVKTVVTLDNLKKKVSDTITRFEHTSKQINDLFGGRKSLPYSVLPELIRLAAEAINNSMTEVQYPPNQGIVLQDPNNPSRMVRLTSAGIGLSEDGGATYKTAITGVGVLAETITAGLLQGMVFLSDDGTSTMWVQGGDIRLTDDASGRNLNLNPLGMTGFNEAGDILFQATKTWVTSGILGTNTTNVYTAAQSNGEHRVVDINGIPGDGLVDSYNYLPIRASGIYGNFWNINPASGLNAQNLYARPLSDGEVRVTANSTTDLYRDLRARSVYANMLENNGLFGESIHTYIKPRSGGEVRATVAGSVDNHVPVRASGYYGDFVDTMATHLYLRPGGDPGEARVTVRGTTDVYQPIRAKDFITDTSVRDNKKNIETFEDNTLDALRNSSAYLYNRNTDKDGARKQLGLMIDELPEVTHSDHGDSFALYALSAFNFKAAKDILAEFEAYKKTSTEQIADLLKRVEALEAK